MEVDAFLILVLSAYAARSLGMCVLAIGVPRPNAPVWPMDAVRDRFLTAFGPQPAPVARPPASAVRR